MRYLKHFFFINNYLLFFLFLIVPFENYAQSYKLKGQVFNAGREPIKNVFISTTREKGMYVTTNKKGKFSIKVYGSDTLVILPEGEDLFVVSLDNRKEAVFILESSGKEMKFEESVYTVLNDMEKEKMLKLVESLRNPPEKFYSTIFDMIREEYPEVTINEGTGEIIVRGPSSVNYTNAALIVVDGVKGVRLSSINPNDVESIRIIKDATAGLYGGLAIGGVVEITTKKGR